MKNNNQLLKCSQACWAIAHVILSRLALSPLLRMECLLQQFDTAGPWGGQDHSPLWWQVVWALVAGHHFLIQVTSKQILPGGCPPSQSRRQLSTLTQSAQSICHSLKIESSLQSGPVSHPQRLVVGMGRRGWEEGDGRRAALGAATFQGRAPPSHHTGRACCASVLAATSWSVVVTQQSWTWMFDVIAWHCVTP